MDEQHMVASNGSKEQWPGAVSSSEELIYVLCL